MPYNHKDLQFPPVSQASPDGFLALGGDLSPERLMVAYRHGIFPWYDEGQSILWWSPNPRMVLFLDEFKVSKSLRKEVRKETFQVTFNEDFAGVIRQCASIKRDGQPGTWILPEMEAAYLKLHALGNAKSVEVWQDGELVGGLYGVDLPEYRIFCGESMFTKVSNASKVALYHWVHFLQEQHYYFIDCQMYTDHLASLGAREIPRKTFMKYLEE